MKNINKKGKITILNYAFGIFVFVAIFLGFYVLPSSSFWNHYGYAPPTNNNLSTTESGESALISTLESVQCSLINLGSSNSAGECPNQISLSTGLDLIKTIIWGGYQAISVIFGNFGYLEVLINTLGEIVGIDGRLVSVIIGFITLSIVISWIMIIFNRGDVW